MKFLNQIPANSEHLEPTVIFTAPWNDLAIAPGAYGFGGAANQNVLVKELLSNSIYMISGWSFAISAPQDEVLDGITSPLEIKFSYRNSNSAVYAGPTKLAVYADYGQSPVVFDTKMGGDALLASMSGTIAQHTNWVGIKASLKAFVTLSIYRILDSEWIDGYRGQA